MDLTLFRSFPPLLCCVVPSSPVPTLVLFSFNPLLSLVLFLFSSCPLLSYFNTVHLDLTTACNQTQELLLQRKQQLLDLASPVVFWKQEKGKSWTGNNNALVKDLESSAPDCNIQDATMMPHTALSGRKSQTRRRKSRATKQTALLSLALAAIPSSMAQKCIPLSGSVQCPAFNQSSFSTDSDLTGLLCVFFAGGTLNS